MSAQQFPPWSDRGPRFSIEELPRGMTGEILDPVVEGRQTHRPGRAHARVVKQCMRALAPFDVEGGGWGWWLGAEHEIAFPDDHFVVPDIAGWRVESTPLLPDENPLTVVPDFVCEVLAPDSAHIDRALKVPFYARAGVAWVWLVSPGLRTVEVFECYGGRARLALVACGEEELVLPPFDMAFDLSSWWLPQL